MDLDASQKEAVAKIATWLHSRPRQEFSVGGYAGTGKTTIVREVVEMVENPAVCAFTGKAVHVLKRKGLVDAQTLHRLLYIPVLDEYGNLIDFERRPVADVRQYDLIIVDEASMVGRELADDLLSCEVPVLWVGDHGQLDPVRGSSAVNKVSQPEVVLETIHRQGEGSDIIGFAQHVREEKHPYEWESTPEVQVVSPADFELSKVRGTVLVGTNAKRHEINAFFRRGKKLLPEPGEPLLVLKNDYKFGIFNGELLTVVEAHEAKFSSVFFVTVETSEGLPMEIPVDAGILAAEAPYRPQGVAVNYGYALTCHKAQGSEWDEVTVLEENAFTDAKWRYTAATRASKKLIYVPASRNWKKEKLSPLAKKMLARKKGRK